VGGNGAPGIVTGSSNPLLAPLQAAPPIRRTTSSDDMPLPNSGTRAAAPAPSQGQGSSVPLPN
jgi:hypothetical protein